MRAMTKSAVALARKSCPAIEESLADTFIAAGTSIEGVRASLFERMSAAQSPEITSAHQAAGGKADDPAAVAKNIVAAYRGPQQQRSA